MKIQTWILLMIAGFMFSPVAGISVIGLYALNYLSSLMFRAWNMYQQRGYK